MNGAGLIFSRKSEAAVESRQQRLDPLIVASLLKLQYPRAYRIALVLNRDPGTADTIAGRVLAAAARRAARWRSDQDAARWFAHYTVILCRENPVLPSPVLEPIQGDIDRLPLQQREAFLLHHGLQMELRDLSTAMDCSTAAAANHLVAAATALRALAGARGESLNDFTSALPGKIASMALPDREIEARITQALESARQRRRFRSIIEWAVIIAVTASVAWLVWRVWPMIVI